MDVERQSHSADDGQTLRKTCTPDVVITSGRAVLCSMVGVCSWARVEGDAVQGVLLTGTSGAGKSTVASEVFELLVSLARGAAFIDLDALAKCDAGEDEGFFGSAVMAENLASVWPNYRRRGVAKLVLARAVPDVAELDRIRMSIPDVRLTVVLIVVDAASLRTRLASRDIGAREGRYATNAVELQDRMRQARLADFTVENGAARSASAVAAEVLERWVTS